MAHRQRVRRESVERPTKTPRAPVSDRHEAKRRVAVVKVTGKEPAPGATLPELTGLATGTPGGLEKPKKGAHLFSLGNKLWMLRQRDAPGQPRLFEEPDDLAQALINYFEWVEANPLIERTVTHFQGEQLNLDAPKMRAMSVPACCLHIGMARSSWDDYKKKEGFGEILEAAQQVMYTQKLEGAAGGLLNATIIIRDLGLKDRTDLTSGDEPVTEIVRRIIDDAEGRKK